eukprot:TRINITY_DN6527_c0_g1_i1.p1 TRINITY_DN6527_c0_g1~~TRINITY_DN6527_c0_g1_i1.p1  ORF type:complete len:152 (+),score=6.53 TRINITY_DN6527_c0_g1_i1:37-492(+)
MTILQTPTYEHGKQRKGILTRNLLICIIRPPSSGCAHDLQASLRLGSRAEVESVGHHELVPHGDEVLDQLLLAIGLTVDLGQSTELWVRTEDEVVASRGPLLGSRLAVDALEHLLVLVAGLPCGVHVEQMTKKSLVSLPGVLVKTPWVEPS